MAAPLTPAEERRCLEFLRRLGITSPDHRILSDRGYFGLFLSGLHPEEVGETDHPSVQEFREIVRLLARAGVDRIRFVIAEQTNAIGKPTPENFPSHPQPPMPPRKPSTYQKTESQVNFTLPRHEQTPEPEAAPKKPTAARPPKKETVSRAQFKRDIAVVKPPAKARERLNNLPHAESLEEAVAASRRHLELAHFHDAHHVLADYLMQKEISTNVVSAINEIITLAGQYDRAKGRAPFNMLWECEETALIVAKRIPDVEMLSAEGDNRTQTLYECMEIVYRIWTQHAMRLLEYKYKSTNTQWSRRSWVEPRDLGFLVDIMKTAVRTHLPLDLLRFVYEQIHEVIALMNNVIAHKTKQARFMGDTLRMIASPGKELVPDLTFEIYEDIIEAYQAEGDTQQAWTFCLQALHIHPNDREMLKIKDELKEQGAMGIRREHQMRSHNRK